jgi:hypothetical protein
LNTAFLAGVDAFIPKPFTMQTFNETFEALLAAREMNSNNEVNN